MTQADIMAERDRFAESQGNIYWDSMVEFAAKESFDHAVKLMLVREAVLREALDFYKSNWRSDVYVGPTEEMLKDFGQTATQALAACPQWEE